MKKIISLLLFLSMLFVAACGNNNLFELDTTTLTTAETQTSPVDNGNQIELDTIGEAPPTTSEAQTPPIDGGNQVDVAVVDYKILGQSIDDLLTDGDFSGTVLVEQGGEIILRKAYGLADVENNIENSIDTAFYIGSTTKQITGAAILALEADGKLDTSDTLDVFFLEYGIDNLKNITVANLLAMGGGFGGVPHREMEAVTSKDVEVSVIHNWSSDNHGYSNSDYWLLGRIIERVSGMTYEEYIWTRLFEPAGMTNSGFGDTHKSALAYSGSGDVFPRSPFTVPYSSGGIVSSVDDLSLWMDAYFGGKLFPETMLERVTGGYNYGWYLNHNPIWHHSGSILGFSTYLIYDRYSDTKIILLSNREYQAHGFSFKISSIVLDVIIST